MKSFRERQAVKVDKFAASLTNESEFFGLLGNGYPHSFYKVYVRKTKDSKCWWIFQWDAHPTRINPIKHQANLKVEGRVATVWAPLRYLAIDFTHDPERKAIAKLFARAAELLQNWEKKK